MYRRVVPAALLVLLLAGAAACGNKSNEPDVAFTVPPQTAKDKPCVEAKAVTASAPAGSALPGSTVVPTTAVPGKPVVKVPVGPPPADLVKTDLKEGTGAEVKPGDAVKVQYIGVACSTGKQFDSSWDKGGQPVDFTLTEGALIPGWVKGIPGMKVGGQRMLVVPAKDGYGAKGQPPDILPEETLVFVIDMVETGPPPSTTTAPAATPGAATGQPTTPVTPAAGAPSTTATAQPAASATVAGAPSTTGVPTTTAAPK